jgi:hypothetical protein
MESRLSRIPSNVVADDTIPSEPPDEIGFRRRRHTMSSSKIVESRILSRFQVGMFDSIVVSRLQQTISSSTTIMIADVMSATPPSMTKVS